MGHERRHPDRLILRISDDDSTQSSETTPKAETRGASLDIRMTELTRHFDLVNCFPLIDYFL